jgi:hypothetical protein
MTSLNNITNMKNLVRSMNLDSLIYEELEDPESEVSEFVNSFTLNFIVKSLDVEDRQNFVDLMLQAEREGSEEGYIKVWDYAKRNISDFEKKYQEKLGAELLRIKNQVIS